MKKQIIIAGVIFALAGGLAGGCVSAPTQTAQKKTQSGCSYNSYTVAAGKTWDAEGLCTLEVMEANNEMMKQNNRMNSGLLGSSASE